MSPLHFQLCNNSICMSLILFYFFQKKSSNLSVIICNPQFYDTYARIKSSILLENISTSLFNYILIIIWWQSLYLSFLNLKFYQLFYVILNLSCIFRWKSSALSENISTSPSNYILNVLVCRSIFLRSFQVNIHFLSIILCNFIESRKSNSQIHLEQQKDPG